MVQIRDTASAANSLTLSLETAPAGQFVAVQSSEPLVIVAPSDCVHGDEGSGPVLTVVFCNATGIKAVAAITGGGDDTVDSSFIGPLLADGGAGGDNITGSPVGDFIYGGPGNDQITGGDGQRHPGRR